MCLRNKGQLQEPGGGVLFFVSCFYCYLFKAKITISSLLAKCVLKLYLYMMFRFQLDSKKDVV